MSRTHRAVAADVTLGVALARLGESALAVEDGRVFVGRRRADTADVAVKDGDEIVVHAASEDAKDIRVLGEWDDLFAVLKPAGLSTEPDRRGGASVVRNLAGMLGVSHTVLHAATRLDTTVSGIVVVARGNEAARRVAAFQEAGLLSRRYLALGSGHVQPVRGTWDAPIGKGEKGRPVQGGTDARPARTRYAVLAETPTVSFFLLEPETGRSHQLRVHAASAGAPLLGDVTRGAPKRLVRPDGRVVSLDRVALHASRVQVVSGEHVEWSVTAPHPADLVSLFESLGGDPRTFDAAAEAPALYAMPRS